MRAYVEYIEGEKNTSSLGIDKISSNLTTQLKNLVNFNRYTYKKVNNSLLKQLYIYLFCPIRIWLSLHKTASIIHISSQGYAHIAHFLPSQKLIITCCDLIPLVFWEENNFAQKALLKFTFSGLKKARKIIAISQSTKNDLIRLLNVPGEKIEVIYPGVSENFRPLNIKKKNLILYVGAYYPSKNLPVLFKAFSKVLKKIPELKLVIVNEKAALPKELSSLTKELKIEDNIVFTGHITEEELIKLYNQAQLLVQPSLYEGFGLPVLEAMACGCPIICTNTSSLPEVVGKAGVLIPPNDIDSLADAIYNVIKDKKLKQDLIKKGLAQAKKFSWTKTADQVYRIYKSIL